ncbi:uncharacterized protein LOC106780609 [Vigna radiata var. radiata]|uniref:Uncharacterized protein LOC106780609 n=1 Tax=Vigna radiata var. radiata TaxID=3916 RepID=A0A1S3W1D2_VIGRR|nr:uncharacterized protein LOC106780609 [Vigna radiata var. radiata]
MTKGFSITRGKVDSTLFIKNLNKEKLYVQIFVDDIIFGSTNHALCKEFSKTMQDEFEMSMMGEMTYFLGLQVRQAKNGIFINQSKYCTDLLKKFKMLDYKEAATPIATNCYLDLDEASKDVDQKMYRGMIEYLLYLTTSKPDIMHHVRLCARFQSSSKESHLTTFKIIFKYLKGTKSLGLWYPNGTNVLLEGYNDSDFGGSKLERKISSGTCHLLGSSFVSWNSKKQACVALPTTEAEYIVVGSCSAQSLWFKSQLEDYGIALDHIPLKCDNTRAINLTKNPVLHSETKHIEIRHHFISDHILKGEIKVEYVDTLHQWLDILQNH